ncbi:MAG: hypothetical protein Ct9H300mP16_17450 [Pseudomonadota bacterium]|nr:MAG: hypothetical protein Ct9H300mP16_17450 [Pseudomonadota bacterium]
MAAPKIIWDKGLIYQDYKVVPYDPRMVRPCLPEVAQGYREVEDPSVTLRFRFTDDSNTSFLVWTTTPWTLPSNLALAFGPRTLIRLCGLPWRELVLAKSLLDSVLGEGDIGSSVRSKDWILSAFVISVFLTT